MMNKKSNTKKTRNNRANTDIKLYDKKHENKRKHESSVSKLINKIKYWLLGYFLIPRMAVIAGILSALIFLTIPPLFQKPPQPQIIIPTIDTKLPLNIEIPRLKVNLPIKEATVSANDWQVYDDAVSWLKGSGNLEKGNVILYGHNSKTLFGSIIQLGIGDDIILKGAGQDRKYKVEKSYQTSRWDLTAVNSQDDKLTMYTCSGWFDANRWFVIAKPVYND